LAAILGLVFCRWLLQTCPLITVKHILVANVRKKVLYLHLLYIYSILF
jgi:hypothetical protein